MSHDLGLSGNVEFAGYQTETIGFFLGARIVVIASDMEGFPFALVEGIAAGAIPVSTDVGTVRDFIEHDVNGVIVPPGDALALSRELGSLLIDHARYERIRGPVLTMRAQFDMTEVTRLWDGWLKQLSVRDRR